MIDKTIFLQFCTRIQLTWGYDCFIPLVIYSNIFHLEDGRARPKHVGKRNKLFRPNFFSLLTALGFKSIFRSVRKKAKGDY